MLILLGSVDTVAPVVTIDPPSGHYAPFWATLAANEPATIYYTLDGSAPTTASPVYAAPIAISSACTLRCFAVDSLGNTSGEYTASYTVDDTAPTASADYAGGTYAPGLSVSLVASETAAIHYTLDGSAPTTASPVYAAPIAIAGPVTTLKFLAVDTVGNQSAVYTEVYTIAIDPLADPDPAWQDTGTPPAPGASGQWGSTPAPQVPVANKLSPIYAVTSYTIAMDGVDVTAKVERCQIDEAESSIFSTCTLDMPVGVAVQQGQAVAVTIAGVVRNYLVEEVTASGPGRSIWCRSAAAVLDAPAAAEQNWNGWDHPHATASALAATLCGGVDLTWNLPDWDLPARWELTGTPIEALQKLVQAVGGIIASNPDGSITCRRRWPVRPPDMSGSTAIDIISRDTALDSGIEVKASPGKGYGSVIVYGYDPAADLPDLEVEEQSPALGSPVHVRAFWKSATPPDFASFITDGAFAKLASGTVQLTEEVTFANGVGSVKYPIKQLHGYSWIGADQGAIWWLANGDSRELSTANPAARGIAAITYTAAYDRFRLTGQTASKCMFGVDVGQGQVSAKVSYISGGAEAPALSAPLANDTTGCIEAGTAFLDANRAYWAVSAELPLTTAALVPGVTVQVDDTVSGLTAKGKVVSARISLESDKTTRRVEVQAPC